METQMTRYIHRLVLIGAAALALAACGEKKESDNAGTRQLSRSATPTPRVRVERRPRRTPTVRSSTRATDAVAPGADSGTTAPVEARPQSTPPPIYHALAALEQIPVTVVDHVTTEQAETVRGAINDLELLYMNARMFRNDREQVEFEEKIEYFNSLVDKLPAAQSPEEMREIYRQLSDGLRLMDAEIQARRRAEEKR